MSDPVRISILPDEPKFAEAGAEVGSEARVIRVHGGEKITGTVEVMVQEDLDFGAFQIGFLWHTEGKGNRVTGSGGAETLVGESHWRAGERISFPFSIVAPWGPLSYSGRVLQVVWSLEARVCRSMLRSDIREGVPVHLSGDPEGQEFDLGPTPQKKSELEAVKRGLGGLWLSLGVVLLFGSLVFGAFRGWDYQGMERLPLFMAMVGGLLLSLKGAWGRLGRGKLGEPVVQLSTSEPRRGEEIRFGLALRPEQRTELRSLRVVLECEERVVHGHGQYQSRRRKTVFERRLSLAKNLVVEPHRGLQRKGTITLPDDAPTSFGAPSNQVIWWLRFEADIVGWPDWKEPFLLTVRP
jgi:hypothetical protein